MPAIVGYPIVAILSVLVTYLIIRHKQREEISRAYDDGYDDRESTMFPAIETDEEINYMRSFSSPVTPQAFDDDDTILGYDHLFKTESSHAEPDREYIPQINPQVTSNQYTDFSGTQVQIDQLCRDMDNECEIYLAQLASHVSAMRATNAYNIYMGSDQSYTTGPIPVVTAREITVTREIIFQGAGATS